MMHKSLVQIGCFLFLQYVLISADPLSSEFKDLRKDRKEFLSGENFTVLPLSLPIPKFIDQDVSESTTFPSQAHPVLAVDAKSARTSKRPGSLQKHRRRKGKRGKHGKRTKGNRVSNNARKNSKYFLESKDLEDQKEILRSTMRYMFGFDHILTTPEMVKQKLATENVGDKSDESSNGREATKLKRRGGKEDMKLEALDLPDPPDFMLELYEVYSKDNSLMMLYSRSQGDTIRSFFPSPADPRFRKMDRGRPVIIVPVSQRENGPNAELVEERKDGYQLDKRIPAFLFNLSSIPSEEELVSVEIRLDGRAKSSSSGFSSFQQRERFGSKEAHLSSWNLKIGVYEIRRTGCRGDVDCSNDDISKVFIKVGMTVAIKSPTITTWSDKELLLLARKARKSDHVMLVKFTREPAEVREELSRSSRHINKSSQNGNDHHEPTSGDLPSAFTVPESERPKRNSDRKKSLASVQPFLSEPLQFGRDFNEFDFELDISRVPMLVIYSNDSRTVEATDAPQISPLIWGALENVTASLTRRTRRSTDNISEMGENQFPETTGGTDDTEYDPNIMQTESDKRRKPYVIKRGKAQSRQTKRINNSLSNDQTELHDNEKSRRFLMDTLKDKNTTRRRRKNKKCEDRKGRRRKSCRKGRKGKGKNIPPHESLEALNRAHLLCGRRSLHVDFADIGWSDWIISPNYFDAYYCSGRCEIPHMQSMQGTSNHAIIQALIKAIGVNKEIPAPCCVPEKLMSLSVLYYDEEKNVVLRVYRNMSVETCSCR